MPPSKDPWTFAHEIAWGESNLPEFIKPDIRHTLQGIFKLYELIEASNQVVHSDLCGNILFSDPLPPLVIDFSPAYHPRAYAEVILVADAIAWENAPITLRKEIPRTPYWDQMLFRALNFQVIVAALFYPVDLAKFEAEFENFIPLLRG